MRKTNTFHFVWMIILALSLSGCDSLSKITLNTATYLNESGVPDNDITKVPDIREAINEDAKYYPRLAQGMKWDNTPMAGPFAVLLDESAVDGMDENDAYRFLDVEGMNIAPFYRNAKTLIIVTTSLSKHDRRNKIVLDYYDIEKKHHITTYTAYPGAHSIGELRQYALDLLKYTQEGKDGRDIMSALNGYAEVLKSLDIYNPASAFSKTVLTNKRVSRTVPDYSKTKLYNSKIQLFIYADLLQSRVPKISLSTPPDIFPPGDSQWLIHATVFYKKDFVGFYQYSGVRGYKGLYNYFLIDGKTGDVITSYSGSTDPTHYIKGETDDKIGPPSPVSFFDEE